MKMKDPASQWLMGGQTRPGRLVPLSQGQPELGGPCHSAMDHLATGSSSLASHLPIRGTDMAVAQHCSAPIREETFRQ